MIQFLAKKILRVIAVLVGATLITFLLMHAIPGNPWSGTSSNPRMQLGLNLDQSLHRELDRHYGLDLPLWRQFTRFLIGDIDEEGKFFLGALGGNLGPSIWQRGRTVQNILFVPPEGKNFWHSRFGYSFRLVLFSSLIAVGMGIPLGFLSGRKPRSVMSRVFSVGLAALISIPNFVLGLLAIIILASWLHIFKVLPDWNMPSNWIVPAVVLAVMPTASIARVTQASVENVLGEDYVRTARGKGLTEAHVMLVHVLRNVLGPIITFLSPTLVEMFAGLMIVEVMFGFPGFGREYWESVLKMDYPVVIGLTFIYALGIAIVNIATEILVDIIDPRLRAIKQQSAP
jgi:oligopeptide transport system permease protein